MAYTPTGKTRAKVRNLSKKGMSVREIGLLLGISTQAVYKHLARINREPQEATGMTSDAVGA
jgi:hypothetical protein